MFLKTKKYLKYCPKSSSFTATSGFLGAASSDPWRIVTKTIQNKLRNFPKIIWSFEIKCISQARNEFLGVDCKMDEYWMDLLHFNPHGFIRMYVVVRTKRVKNKKIYCMNSVSVQMYQLIT